MGENRYMETWVKLNNKMVEGNFTWGTLEEEEDYHQYMSYNLFQIDESKFNQIKEATEAIGEIVNKTYHYIIDNPTLQLKLNIPYETLDAIQVKSTFFSYFTRLDLVLNNDEIKLIEINCDTPTGYLETSVANKVICEHHGHDSPNHLEDAIFNAWIQIMNEYQIDLLKDTVYFTSYGWHEEDRQTVLFNMKHSGLTEENAKYIPLEDIVVSDDGIYDQEGNKIEFLYRLYPLEHLVDDEDDAGRPIGQMLLDFIANGEVKVINPPSAFMMQTKAVMALIWEFAENDRLDLFTREELDAIKKYFIPTYWTNEPFTAYKHNAIPHVEKPVFGREGGGVKIFDENFSLVAKDEEDWYSEYAKVYQKYVEMPEFTIDTWDEPYTGKLLVGSFLIGQEAAGIFIRVGEKITGNLSMFCGVAVKKDN